MVTDGDQTINSQLFTNVIEQNSQEITSSFESLDDTSSPKNNLSRKYYYIYSKYYK